MPFLLERKPIELAKARPGDELILHEGDWFRAWPHPNGLLVRTEDGLCLNQSLIFKSPIDRDYSKQAEDCLMDPETGEVCFRFKDSLVSLETGEEVGEGPRVDLDDLVIRRRGNLGYISTYCRETRVAYRYEWLRYEPGENWVRTFKPEIKASAEVIFHERGVIYCQYDFRWLILVVNLSAPD